MSKRIFFTPSNHRRAPAPPLLTQFFGFLILDNLRCEGRIRASIAHRASHNLNRARQRSTVYSWRSSFVQEPCTTLPPPHCPAFSSCVRAVRLDHHPPFPPAQSPLSPLTQEAEAVSQWQYIHNLAHPVGTSATILLCTRGSTSSYRRLLPLLDSMRTEIPQKRKLSVLSKSKDKTIKQKEEDGMGLCHIHSYLQLLHNNSASRPRQPKPQRTNNHAFQ